jgi:hypothetical protein
MKISPLREFLERSGLTESQVAGRLTDKGYPTWVVAGLLTGQTFALAESTLLEIEREQKRYDDFGPVTLWYGNRPLGQPGHGNLYFEDFRNTKSALQRVRKLRESADFHHPRITDGEMSTIWHEADLLASVGI